MSERARTSISVAVIVVALPVAFLLGRMSAPVEPPPPDTALDRSLDEMIRSNQEAIRQRNNAVAKRQVREAAAALDRCHQRRRSYVACDVAAEGVPLGVGEGTVDVRATTDAGYVVVGRSQSGCGFVLEKQGDRVQRSVDGDRCAGETW